MRKILDVKIGDIFGDLQCIDKYIIKGNGKGYKYVMKCSICGREKEMLSSTIRLEHGLSHKACGKGLKTLNKKFYNLWQGMRMRTTKDNYVHTDDYKARGINSEEWKYFIDFYDDMYASYQEACKIYGEKNVSLERKDVNGNYCKENCCWIDVHRQQSNTRRSLHCSIEYPDGIIKKYTSLRLMCTEHNLKYTAVHWALFFKDNGYTLDFKPYKIKLLDK